MSKTMPPNLQPTEQSASDQQIQADGVPSSDTPANRRARAELKRIGSQHELTDKYGAKVPAQLPSKARYEARELVMREMMEQTMKHHAESDVAVVRGALSAEKDRCPYKRNTSNGTALAARWEKGRALAAQLRAEGKVKT